MSYIMSSPNDFIVGEVLNQYGKDEYYIKVSHIGVKNKMSYNNWETVLVQNKLPKKIGGKKLVGKIIKCTIQYRDVWNRILCEAEIMD